MNKRHCGHYDEKGNRMRSKPDWKPLAIVGAALLVNGFVFLLITLSTSGGALWGAALGYLIAGVPLMITGEYLCSEVKFEIRNDTQPLPVPLLFMPKNNRLYRQCGNLCQGSGFSIGSRSGWYSLFSKVSGLSQ